MTLINTRRDFSVARRVIHAERSAHWAEQRATRSSCGVEQVTSAGVHVVPTSMSSEKHESVEQKHEPSVRRQQWALVHELT